MATEGGWRVKRLTVEADRLEPIDPFDFTCLHEVTWFNRNDYLERCAICGLVLGFWKGKPRDQG